MTVASTTADRTSRRPSASAVVALMKPSSSVAGVPDIAVAVISTVEPLPPVVRTFAPRPSSTRAREPET